MFRTAHFIALIGLLGCVACQRGDYSWVAREAGNSILDLEYINDTLGIRIQDIRVERYDQDNFKISVYMFPEDFSRYEEGYRFYLHLYAANLETTTGYMAVGTRQVTRKKDALVHSRIFQTSQKSFESLRFGLLNQEGDRLFSLKVDTVAIRLDHLE